MAFEQGTNSYAAVEDADAYFADRFQAESWFDLELTDKQKVLVSGTDFVDSLCTWNGDKADVDQPLEFPRDSDTVVPNDILVALYEICLEIVKQGKVSFVASSDSIKTLKAGPATLSFYEKLTNPLTIVNSLAKSKLRKHGECAFGDDGISSVRLQR